MVRPGQLFRVSVTLLQQKKPITVRASIQRNGVEVSTDHKDVKVGIPETLLMKVRLKFLYTNRSTLIYRLDQTRFALN